MVAKVRLCLLESSRSIAKASLSVMILKSLFLYYNAGHNNLAKTSNCVFLSRKVDIAELPPLPISMLFLKCLSVNMLRLQH